jgi:hypothetical protein
VASHGRTSGVEGAGGPDTEPSRGLPGAGKGSRGEDRSGCWPGARDLEEGRRQTSSSGKCARSQVWAWTRTDLLLGPYRAHQQVESSERKTERGAEGSLGKRASELEAD